MRLPYTPPASPLWNPPAVASTLSRRALRPSNAPPTLLPLDRALLHSPPLAAGWNALLGALRDRAALAPSAFELVAVRVAALTGAAFEYAQHAPLLEAALRRRGLEPAEVFRTVCAARDAVPGAFAAQDGGVDGVAERDAAVLAVVDTMTGAPGRGVGGAEWARLGAVCGSEREYVELVASVGAYNMVSRFLTALDVAEKGRWDERLRGVEAKARAKL